MPLTLGLVPNDDLALLLRLNKSWYDGIPPDELYEITRAWWVMSVANAERVVRVLAVAGGLVREVYEPAEWLHSPVEGLENRIGFNGSVASDRDKYVGRDVKLLRNRQQNGTSVQEEVTAHLLAYNDAPVWQIGGEIVTGLQAEQYRFPEIPDNLHSRPTLVWQLANQGQPRHRIETSYLANNMNWHADYVLTVGRDDGRADLDGWVTVLNTSGTSYRNAQLQLVAGDLNRVRQDADALSVLERRAASAAKDEAFRQESFSEYHLYSLERRTTLSENETKQISMLTGTGVPVQKMYVVNGQQFYYRNRQQPGAPIRDAVRVFYSLRNDLASGLGMPMPAGTVRVYQADSRGGVQFAGEDHIGHTPKDEDISLQIGTAFDVVCDRKQTDYTRISDNVFEVGYEITLRNHKSNAITVQVNEPIAGDWQMLSATFPAKKTAAFAAQFEVPVPTDGESVLRYRVRVRY